VWPFLIVVSTPSLQLIDDIRKGQEPVRTQAFRAESTIERINERIIRGLAGPGEVQRDAALVGSEAHIARNELDALVDADRLGIARLPTDPIRRSNHIFASVAELRIQNRHVAREGINEVRTRSSLSVASWS
jgi:hypothetical protein